MDEPVTVVNEDDSLSHRLVMRAFLGGVEYSFEQLPVRQDETLARSDLRATGALLESGSVRGAIFDVGVASRTRYPASSLVRPAVVTLPGHFGSFWHDYRADVARMVLYGLGLPSATEEQIVAVEEALVDLDLDKAERIKAAKEEYAPAPPSSVEEGGRIAGGVPLVGSQTSGAQSLWSIARSTGVRDGDGQ